METSISGDRNWRISKSRCAVGLALILSCTATGWAQPDLTPLRFLAGDSAIGPAVGNQTQPAIARGGDQFLAVWTDSRAGGGGLGNSGLDIYATLLDANGTVLQPSPVLINQNAAEQSNARIAWNGENWLVVWESQEPTVSYWSAAFQATRVSPQGVVLDDPPISVIKTTSSSAMMTLASDGTNWLVVTQGTSAGDAATRATRISAQGAVLNPGGTVLLPEAYYLRGGLGLVFAGDEFLLVWDDLNNPMAQRFSPTLESLGAAINLPAGSAPRVATNGDSFLVVADRPSGVFESVIATRVTHTGQVQDPAGIVVDGQTGYGPWPTVAWDGARWFVTWGDGGVRVARVTSSGVVQDPGGIPVDPAHVASESTPELAGAPAGGVQTIWVDTRNGSNEPYDIYGAPVSASAAPGVVACIALAASSQYQPSLAADGNGYMIAFLSLTSAGRRVLSQRVNLAGNSLMAEPVEIARGPDLSSPHIAWDGSRYLVVWTNGTNLSATVCGRRLLPDGTLLDSAPIAIMSGSESVVAANGPYFLVVSTDQTNFGEYRFPVAVRVRGQDGTVLGPSVPIGGSFSFSLSIAPFGANWLVAWEYHGTHDDPHSVIAATLIHPDGTAIPAFVAGGVGLYSKRPTVAASDTLGLIAWDDARVGNYDLNVYARRIQLDGTLLDGTGIALTTAPNNQIRAAVGWDGTEFVAGFEDQRATTFFLDGRTDVFGARVDEAGQVLDPAGFAVANGVASEIQPDVSGANGTAMLAAAVYRESPPFAAFRVGLRALWQSHRGDVDGDGDVDLSDLTLLLASFGLCAGDAGFNSDADFDGNGCIELGDLATLLASFGS